MAEPHYYQQLQHLHDQPPPRSHQLVKAATAVTAGGSLLVLSALTLAATVIGLTLVTPLLVIFSPVLVPAAIAVCLLAGGFVASGGFGMAAVGVLAWIYRYVTGQQPLGAEQLEQAKMKLAGKAREMKEKAEQYAHQQQHGGQTGS
ncbi:oleosin L-like [Diospyros lotus]|uniref:oleosin L-like n=1 Tax=Diospyros lotus TaxID=55363 RepID=UPI002258468E|nr:oleosin L-like [Diospyros lotus]